MLRTTITIVAGGLTVAALALAGLTAQPARPEAQDFHFSQNVAQDFHRATVNAFSWGA
jgi:hypothetical protein